jgi:hypothetical protein
MTLLRPKRGSSREVPFRAALLHFYGGVRERVRDALHTGIEQALAVMTSHYASLNL